MADRVVLDASAILAALQNEPGGSVISALLDAADVLIAVSAVNHSEVVSKLVRDGVSEADVLVLTSSFARRVHPFSLIQAHTCGSLIAKTGPLGLSLGDRACLSLAIDLKATVWTTDRSWAALDLPITIKQLR